jgi:hypothetical protein
LCSIAGCGYWTDVAQLAEQRIPNPQVGGSSPSVRVLVMALVVLF